jgi:hypothetical protein
VKGNVKILGHTVAQFPNLPLAVALFGLVLSWLFSSGSTAYGVARAIFYVGLAVWAWLELTDGVNGFRRALGAGGLVFVIVRLSEVLEA